MKTSSEDVKVKRYRVSLIFTPTKVHFDGLSNSRPVIFVEKN